MPDGATTLLAFDYGLKQIGIAVGQTITQTATPVGTLKARNGQPNWDEINQLIKTWQPEQLVVGLPLNIDGSEQPFTAYAKRFAGRLKGRTHLPTQLWDERRTTKDAKKHLLYTQGSKAITKTNLDSTAAQLILEDWLAHHVTP